MVKVKIPRGAELQTQLERNKNGVELASIIIDL